MNQFALIETVLILFLSNVLEESKNRLPLLLHRNLRKARPVNGMFPPAEHLTEFVGNNEIALSERSLRWSFPS